MFPTYNGNEFKIQFESISRNSFFYIVINKVAGDFNKKENELFSCFD